MSFTRAKLKRFNENTSEYINRKHNIVEVLFCYLHFVIYKSNQGQVLRPNRIESHITMIMNNPPFPTCKIFRTKSCIVLEYIFSDSLHALNDSRQDSQFN